MKKVKNAFKTIGEWFGIWRDLSCAKHVALTLGSALIFGLGGVIGDLIHNPRPEEPVTAEEEASEEAELARCPDSS
jgi:hypothetical protein